MQNFELQIDGRVYAGTWRAGDYDRLTVEGPHGSTYAYLDGRDPLALARSLLAELIRRSELKAG